MADDLSARQKKVLRAAEFVKSDYNNRSLKVIWSHFPTIGENRFRALLNNPENVLQCDDDEQAMFLKYYQQESRVQPPYERLYSASMEILKNDEDQSGLGKYEGSYRVFRLSDEEGELITGSIVMAWDDEREGWFFKHRSMQPRDGEDSGRQYPYDHEGPVLSLGNRLYLLGLGEDIEGAYMRPMILRAVDRPRSKPLTGILMTEKSFHVPFACKTVLIADERYSEMLEAESEADVAKQIFSWLENESETEGIIYGWSLNVR